jgi:glycosyltransferase involved in cell wall biosynthesis
VDFIPYERDRAKVAQYYQAADLYLHAARAEVWGLTITEALACGTPVIATAVGGIPEQVKGLCLPEIPSTSSRPNPNKFALDEATGVLVNAGDVNGFADAILHLLSDESLRQRLAANASRDARLRFDLNRYVSDYFGWYEEILQRRRGENGHSTQPTRHAEASISLGA